MNVSDLVKFNRENFYNGAVQTEWFYDDSKIAGISGSYVFHGPKYYGVSDSDVKPGEHKLLDTASYVQKIAQKVSNTKTDNDFVLTIARYGTGKSHLAVTIGALLSGDPGIQKAIIENIKSVDRDIASEIEKQVKKKNLIIALNGMKNFNLDSEVLRCVRETMEKDGIDDEVLRSITKTYDVAKYFINSNYDTCLNDFVKAAKESKLDVDKTDLKEYLLKNIESDSRVINTVNIVLKKITGDSLHWEQGISAGDIILKVCQELCGDGKPFNKLVILFDEFGRYIEYVAANPAIAGDASLQQIFEAIQSADGAALFVGFIQYELEAYLSHIDKTSNVIRYVSRYSTSEKYYLSSNFETILANLLQKNDSDKFDIVISTALSRYKNYHDRIHTAMIRWAGDKVQKKVWISDMLYKKVIMRGCYPLHPLTVWILSNSEGWMQQRSTISFCADMYDAVSDESIEDYWLPYVYPVDIIDSGIFSEMLNSEEEGRVQNQNCMLYNEICTKKGDKFTYEEKQILKAVLVTRIAGFRFFDKEDAYTAFRYCTNLKEEVIKPAIKNLEDRHGVISFDDQSNTYDLIAEANGFNEFKRIYARYNTGVQADIENADEEMLDALGITTPVETSFAQENHISSSEWTFEKRLLNTSSIDESYLNSLLMTLDSSFDAETSRGAALYAYCCNGSESEIERLSDICAKLNIEETPIIILFLDDPDGEILDSMTVKNTIKKFSVSDSERFSKHIIAQNRGKDKKINQKFNAMVIERKRISSSGLITYSGRLNTLCTERFSKVYKTPVPFVFDGFENKKSAQAKKTLINLCVKLFDHSLMNVQSYQALSTADKNRVKSCLSTGVNYSWQVFNESCQLVLPQNELMKSIYREVDAAIPEEDSISVNKLFGKYLHAPYGMNIYSYVLFVLYFIEKHEQHLLAYIGNERLTPESLNNTVFKGQKFKLSDLQKVSIRRNLNVDIDLVAALCNEIIENTDVYACGRLRKKLNDTIQAEGEGTNNQLIIGQARLRLDDGDKISKTLDERRERIQQFLDEGMVKFVPHKFVGIFSYVDDQSGLIEANLPFVYPQNYVEFMHDVHKRINNFMGETFEKAIEALTCSDITKLSSFQNTYSKIVKLLREQNYEEQATLTEERVNQIVEETKARNQYSQALGECEKDIALFSDVRNVSYPECESIQTKFVGWTKFLSDTSLPSSIATPLNNRIDGIIKSIKERKREIVDEANAIDEDFEKAGYLTDLVRLKPLIESMIASDISEEMDSHLMEKLKEIEETELCVQELPQTIDDLVAFIDAKVNKDRIVVLNEAKRLQERLLANQQDWINKIIIPVEEGTITDAQKCSLWIEKLTSIPAFVDVKTTKRAQEASDIVTKQLHACKVQGVLHLYNSLTTEERKEFLKLIQANI